MGRSPTLQVYHIVKDEGRWRAGHLREGQRAFRGGGGGHLGEGEEGKKGLSAAHPTLHVYN